MVWPGETGWVTDTKNVRALRQSIEQALGDDETRERRRDRCREVVEEEYTLATQTSGLQTCLRRAASREWRAPVIPEREGEEREREKEHPCRRETSFYIQGTCPYARSSLPADVLKNLGDVSLRIP
jgi:hypothetical protein